MAKLRFGLQNDCDSSSTAHSLHVVGSAGPPAEVAALHQG